MRATIVADTVAAPIFANVLPRTSVARSFSGLSSHDTSFWARRFPSLARCLIRYLLLAKIAVSESEKKAENTKRTNKGSSNREVDIEFRRLSDRNFTARFGNGFIDALLNFAGAVPQIDLFQMTDAQWDDGMALKFHGARRLTIEAWKALKASNGSAVFMSGSAAFDPKPGFAAVAAINAAINALAKAFATAKCRETVAWARELLGGNGIVADYKTARFFTDCEALYSYEGTYQMQNLIIGKAITGLGAFV